MMAFLLETQSPSLAPSPGNPKSLRPTYHPLPLKQNQNNPTNQTIKTSRFFSFIKVDHEKTSRFVWSRSGCSLHIPLVSMDSIAGFKLGDLRLWDGRGSSGGANVFVVERSQIDAQTCT
jgi:hypothetical protein